MDSAWLCHRTVCAGISTGAETGLQKSAAAAAARRHPDRLGGPRGSAAGRCQGGKANAAVFSSVRPSDRPCDVTQQNPTTATIMLLFTEISIGPQSSAALPPLGHSLTLRKSTPSANLDFGHLKTENRKQCCRGKPTPDGLNKHINLGISLTY